MVRFASKQLDETITPADGATKVINIPRDRYVRDIMLDVQITLKNASSAAVSVSEADWIGLINRLRCVINGNDNLIDVNGYRKWLMEWFLWNTKPYNSLPSSVPASGTATARFEIPIAFARTPANPFDLSAAVPAT